ncbi:ABC transporter ATP-binding protein [candidate division KSB1 bacterium]|nr:ABC transporter ATP-binding protein [candidate division KSB1 bacterium]
MEKAIIQIENLHKSYSMGQTSLPVLNGLNLQVSRGELVAIMGRSGSGKSTLLNILAGLERIDAGEVRVHGQTLNRLGNREKVFFRRNNLGIIYQFFNLVPALTVEENVTLPFLIAGSRDTTIPQQVAEMLEYIGMSGRRRHLPSQLSGGEMQLVSIARALIRRPAIILADEPTGNVNLETGKLIMQKLRAMITQYQSSLLLVTHSPKDASWADRIVFLKDGQIEPAHELSKGETDAAYIYRRLKELGI